jgi:hypothetical protein
MERDKSLKAYKLAFPADLDVERVVAWLHTTSGSLRPRMPHFTGVPTLVFELWSTESGFTYRLMVPWQYSEYIVGQLRTLVPGIHVTPDDQYPRRRWTRAVEVGLQVPTRQLQIGTPSDVAQSLIKSSEVTTGEAMVLQWIVTPAKRQHMPIQRETRTHHRSAGQALRGNVIANQDEVNDRRDKLKEPNMAAVLRVAAFANTPIRAKHLIMNVRRSFSARASAGTGFKRRMVSTGTLQKRIDDAETPLAFPMLLSLTELASFIAWPLGNPNVAGLPPVVARHIAPTEIVPKAGRIIGISNVPGRERPVALDYLNARKHMHVISPTGAGKTTLLINMFRQDIEQGHGAVIIETKGDMFKQALENIPTSRRNDVIIFDVNDVGRPLGFNVLDQGDPNAAMDEVALLFEHLYNTGTRGVWTRQVMHFGLQALSIDKRYTLLDLVPLLSPQTEGEEAWREMVIKRQQDERVIEFFKRLDQTPQAKREQIIAPVLDRMWELSRPKLQPILGQSTSSFQMSDVIKNNKILLVNLSNVEREAGLLMGTLLLNTLWNAVKRNPVTKPNFLYLDEFQNMLRLPVDTADMLTQARSFGLGMVLANQHLGQLTGDMQEAVMNNARTKVVFQTAGQDAVTFAKAFGSLVSADDLTHLGQYQAVARVATDGSVSQPFTVITNPPAKPYGGASVIRETSRETYGRAIGDVQREQIERRQAEAPTTTTSDERFPRWKDW